MDNLSHQQCEPPKLLDLVQKLCREPSLAAKNQETMDLLSQKYVNQRTTSEEMCTALDKFIDYCNDEPERADDRADIPEDE